jgi:hypothetical protein
MGVFVEREKEKGGAGGIPNCLKLVGRNERHSCKITIQDVEEGIWYRIQMWITWLPRL